MRIQFIRGTALGGVGNDAHPGEIRDLREPRALALVAAGRAILLPEAAVIVDAPVAEVSGAKATGAEDFATGAEALAPAAADTPEPGSTPAPIAFPRKKKDK